MVLLLLAGLPGSALRIVLKVLLGRHDDQPRNKRPIPPICNTTQPEPDDSIYSTSQSSYDKRMKATVEHIRHIMTEIESKIRPAINGIITWSSQFMDFKLLVTIIIFFFVFKIICHLCSCLRSCFC